MHRAVADTNVLIRALTGGPGSSNTLSLWQTRQIELVVCPETLAELADVLFRPRFHRYFTTAEARRLLTLLRQHGVWIESVPGSAWSRDSKDYVFINLALVASAHYIVSEDADLVADTVLKDKLMLDHGIRIIRDAELVSVLKQP